MASFGRTRRVVSATGRGIKKGARSVRNIVVKGTKATLKPVSNTLKRKATGLAKSADKNFKSGETVRDGIAEARRKRAETLGTQEAARLERNRSLVVRIREYLRQHPVKSGAIVMSLAVLFGIAPSLWKKYEISHSHEADRIRESVTFVGKQLEEEQTSIGAGDVVFDERHAKLILYNKDTIKRIHDAYKKRILILEKDPNYIRLFDYVKANSDVFSDFLNAVQEGYDVNEAASAFLGQNHINAISELANAVYISPEFNAGIEGLKTTELEKYAGFLAAALTKDAAWEASKSRLIDNVETAVVYTGGIAIALYGLFLIGRRWVRKGKATRRRTNTP